MCRAAFRPHRLMVRTSGFQPGNRGSTPRGVANIKQEGERCSELARNRSRKAAGFRPCGFDSHPLRKRKFMDIENIREFAFRASYGGNGKPLAPIRAISFFLSAPRLSPCERRGGFVGKILILWSTVKVKTKKWE